MFLHVSVILSGGGGVCLSACWDTYWNAYLSLYSNVIFRSRGKVIFSEACVENSVHRGGCLPNCMLGYPCPPPPPTRGRHPPGADTPTTQCMLGDTGNKRAVRILLEFILVFIFKCCCPDAGYMNKLSQMPVVLVPLHFDRDVMSHTPSCQHSVAIRTFLTQDFMTGVSALPGKHLPEEVSLSIKSSSQKTSRPSSKSVAGKHLSEKASLYQEQYSASIYLRREVCVPGKDLPKKIELHTHEASPWGGRGAFTHL